jgi:hypothetical protein
MKLEIPSEERDVLRRWLVEDEPRMKHVLAALAQAQPALARATLAKEVARHTGLDETLAGQLVRALINLSATVWGLAEEDRDKAADIIFQTLQPAGGDRTTFDAHLAQVLELPALEITGKAAGVLGDSPQLFCAARTLSEIRPVFRERGLEPNAAVIVHQLKLAYHDGPDSDRKELFITMDKEDLTTLRSVIDRAIAKHEKLVALVNKLDLPLL